MTSRHSSDFHSKSKSKSRTSLHIVSATYGPSEGRRLLDGTLVDTAKIESFVPYTRDVLPFVRALIIAAAGNASGNAADDSGNGEREAGAARCDGDDGDDAMDSYDASNDRFNDISKDSTNRHRLREIVSHTFQNAFPLMDGKRMNSVFGDPCPGTTKLLRISYFFRDCFFDGTSGDDNSHVNDGKGGAGDSDGCNHHDLIGQNGQNDQCTQNAAPRRKRRRFTTSQIFQSTFAEHERVLLRRQEPVFRISQPAGVPLHQASQESHNMEVDCDQNANHNCNTDRHSNLPQSHISFQSSQHQQYQLLITEMTLPILLPFLTVKQRALCQLVCSSWRHIVKERGIATVVDINDVALFPRCDRKTVANDGVDDNSNNGSNNDANQGSNHNRIISHRLRHQFLNTNIFHSTSLRSPPRTLATSMLQTSNRPLLRGILAQSFSSLESLVLNDFASLHPPTDLHWALPHLRQLRRMDVSRIPSIGDETLLLLATHVGTRLEVLTMKGLCQVTDEGITALAQSCTNLRVLDVSHNHQLEDASGVAIGRYLTNLEVLHGRDNYKWTNESVDVITMNCRKLTQLTLWGCIRLKHIRFNDNEHDVNEVNGTNGPNGGHTGPLGSNGNLRAMHQENSGNNAHSILHPMTFHPPSQLVLLSLWGCHSLTDTTASIMGSMTQLRSLSVSECHKLTDQFILQISQTLPHLIHLQMRYLRRVTDISVRAIGCRMRSLYSLDLSFCTKVTIHSIMELLQTSHDHLAELRLYSCHQLDLEGSGMMMVRRDGTRREGGVNAGGRIVQVLRQNSDHVLSMLDVRNCQRQELFARDSRFIGGMEELGFEEKLRGLFVREVRWNEMMERHLVKQLGLGKGRTRQWNDLDRQYQY